MDRGIYAILACIGAVVVLLMNSSVKEEALTQKCPKCKKRTFHRLKPSDPRYSTSKWKCSNCGNDEDEFGNKI